MAVSKGKYMLHVVLSVIFRWLQVQLCDDKPIYVIVLVKAEHIQRQSNRGEDFKDWNQMQQQHRWRRNRAYSWLWSDWRNQSWGDYRFWKQHWTLRQRLLWIWSLAMRTLQGREKQILGPPSMQGPVWAVFHFNALCVYKGESGDEVFFPPPLCGRTCVLDSTNSDLHFPCTPCEMFSDVGSVTAIIYKPPNYLPPSIPILTLRPRQFERIEDKRVQL